MNEKLSVDDHDVIDIRDKWRGDEQHQPVTGGPGAPPPPRRRRGYLWAVPALLMLAVVVAVVVPSGDSAVDRLAGDGETAGGQAADTEVVPSTSPVSEGSDPSVSAPPTQPPTSEPATTTTGPEAGTTPLSLPPADPALPPQEAIGYFRSGKVYLEGSVPTVEAASGYLRKAAAILGPENVFMKMKLDPRSPVGPARVIVEERFEFPTGSSEVNPKYDSLLGLGAFALDKIPEARLVITGYTDDQGDAEDNRILSQRRAQTIVDYMEANGIPADRVIAIGRGEASPIADNSTPEGRARNRRIEGSLEGIMP